MKYKEDCIFCQISSGEAPASKVFEDDYTVAFADRYPAAPGHILVIPREHYRNILELPEEVAGQVMQTTTRVANAVDEALEPEGINLLQSNGKAARQSVFHFHMHIIPRFDHWEDDENISLYWSPLTVDRNKLDKTAKKIADNLP